VRGGERQDESGGRGRSGREERGGMRRVGGPVGSTGGGGWDGWKEQGRGEGRDECMGRSGRGGVRG